MEDAAGSLDGLVSSSCKKAYNRLNSHLPSQLFPAKDGGFQLWDQKLSEQTPAFRVEPTSAEEVSLCLRTFREMGCKFVIKSGGHSRTPGASNCDGGVVLDLVRLNQITVSDDRESVRVGPGLRWAEVYEMLEPYGISVVGGRHGNVGVGGYLLGGGLSFLMNSHGWACDNVLSFEVVLSSGDIITADVDHHTELFRVLRGAGCSNYGVVTCFQLRTMVPRSAGLWFGIKAYPWTERRKVFEENHSLLTKGMEQDKDATMFIHFFGYKRDAGINFLSTMQFHGSHSSDTTWPSVYQPFSELPSLNEATIHVQSHSQIARKIGSLSSPAGFRNLWGWMTYKPSVDLDEQMVEVYLGMLEKVKHLKSVDAVVVQQPVPLNAIRHTAGNGGNALGIMDSDGPLMGISFGCVWKEAADDEICIETAQQAFAEAEKKAKEMGRYHPYKYMNYAEGWQDLWAGYGGEENLKWLEKLQRKYDPEGLFTRGGLADGFFKLNEKPH